MNISVSQSTRVTEPAPVTKKGIKNETFRLWGRIGEKRNRPGGVHLLCADARSLSGVTVIGNPLTGDAGGTSLLPFLIVSHARNIILGMIFAFGLSD